MIRTTSVHSFVETLPTNHEKAEFILSIQLLKPEQVRPALARLAQRGYLGCLPFAKDEYDEIVLRLLPNRKLEDNPIAVTSGQVIEGLTIASNLSRFVPGRLAQRNVVTHRSKELHQPSEELQTFASCFGDCSSTEAVIAALAEIEQTEKPLRPGKTWQVADASDPLCQTLAAAWTLKRPALGEWAIAAIDQYPDLEIVWRLFVSHHILTRTGQEISDIVYKLIKANDIFDSTYISRYPKPATGAWEIEALVLGIRWLQTQPETPITIPACLWEAAQAFARAPHEKDEQLQYDGRLHLAAAQELAATEPELAYQQALNAAGFFARVHHKILPEALIQVYDLCKENQWTDLLELYTWTRDELGI